MKTLTLESIHENLFQFLLKERILFVPRKINRGNRLGNGYWFIGNEEYLSIGLAEGTDGERKVHNIGLQVTIKPGGGFELSLFLTARDEPKRSAWLSTLVKNIEGCESSFHCWTKHYGEAEDMEELKLLIKQFLVTDKKIIDKALRESSVSERDDIKIITSDVFGKHIDRINEYRKGNPIAYTGHRTIKHKKIFRGRQGTDQRKVENHLRKVLTQRIEIEPIHNKLQQNLFEQLRQATPRAKVIMEENFVDIILETEDEIILYEVKPFDSATRCLREAIGQLLQYAFQLGEFSRKVKLIVAGPAAMRQEDEHFLHFLRSHISFELDYLSG